MLTDAKFASDVDYSGSDCRGIIAQAWAVWALFATTIILFFATYFSPPRACRKSSVDPLDERHLSQGRKPLRGICH